MRRRLHILSYRIVSSCGEPDISLLTADAERAFLTLDSGFPLTELEQTVEGGEAFEYSVSSTAVPVLFGARGLDRHWQKESWRKQQGVSGRNPKQSRPRPPVWALSKMDPETRVFLQRNLGIRKLLQYGAVLDFYGSHICIRRKHALVPGGVEAESAWEDLAGAAPNPPPDFIPRLLSKDKGWLAAYV